MRLLALVLFLLSVSSVGNAGICEYWVQKELILIQVNQTVYYEKLTADSPSECLSAIQQVGLLAFRQFKNDPAVDLIEAEYKYTDIDESFDGKLTLNY